MRPVFITILLALTSCIAPPDTNPVIESAAKVQIAMTQSSAAHRALVTQAVFDDDPIENERKRNIYLDAISRQERRVDMLLSALITWAQRVGEFDQEWANRTLDQIVAIYTRTQPSQP